MTDTPIVTEADIAVALKHIGFDSVADLHYWATDNSELNRFDALCDTLACHRIAHTAELVDALREARSLICSGEQSDAVYHVRVARAAAIMDAALTKAGGLINE